MATDGFDVMVLIDGARNLREDDPTIIGYVVHTPGRAGGDQFEAVSRVCEYLVASGFGLSALDGSTTRVQVTDPGQIGLVDDELEPVDRLEVHRRVPGVFAAGTPELADLVDRSSLGTPGAKALRSRTPPDVAEAIVARSGAAPRPRTIDSELGTLRFWGSECECGNATYGSMRCDTCHEPNRTTALWIEDRP